MVAALRPISKCAYQYTHCPAVYYYIVCTKYVLQVHGQIWKLRLPPTARLVPSTVHGFLTSLHQLRTPNGNCKPREPLCIHVAIYGPTFSVAGKLCNR